MTDRLRIRRAGTPLAHPIASLLNAAFEKALGLDTRLPDSVLQLDGMSGRNYRMCINNLIGSLPSARYLEIGSWRGSTACSAIYGNTVTALCIDNWSQFGGPKDDFLSNIEQHKNKNVNFRFIESDFRAVDYSTLGKFNVYMFDGPHSVEDQYDGVALAQPALDDVFLLIVDDWNWHGVQRGTRDAIAACNLETLFEIEVMSTTGDVYPKIDRQNSDWHNGYIMVVLQKRRAV